MLQAGLNGNDGLVAQSWASLLTEPLATMVRMAPFDSKYCLSTAVANWCFCSSNDVPAFRLRRRAAEHTDSIAARQTPSFNRQLPNASTPD
jgi:hypothetical protein